MASSEKFTAKAVFNQLRHIERQISNPSNKDIELDKSDMNYFLSPERDISSYSYYKQRLEELYVYNRADVIHMVGWVITAPKDLAEGDEENFFLECYRFLEKRYGEKNVISAVVHRDESGKSHMHYCFIPAVADKKRGGEKLCVNDVLTPREMNNFHPALQKHLNDNGVKAKVLTGVTRAQGGNRSVRQLKQERARTHQHTRERGRWG